MSKHALQELFDLEEEHWAISQFIIRSRAFLDDRALLRLHQKLRIIAVKIDNIKRSYILP